MGIISAWKLRYHSLLLRSFLKDVKPRQQKSDNSSALSRGVRGLAEGHDFHMLDVTHMVRQIWEEVTDMTMARCWVKLDALPVSYSSKQ